MGEVSHVVQAVLALEPPVANEEIRRALESLSKRLGAELSSMKRALRSSNTEDAGFHLAQVNQILELLQALDPAGELARNHDVSGAPPMGRTWPSTAWSVVEFAESPLSALLPPTATDETVRGMLYSAWGVSLEPA